MFLKSLTLRGFKSFAEKTVLDLEPGITVIVGPNGSGKSNIVDAIAWVLGEQGAKSLRGGKMDDVIFGGAGNRGPLGRAEVTLTIDNTAGVLPVDYAEISIARLLYRSGDSEYAMNGTTCRLLDIQELLSDTGVGRELHTIVSQGHLDDVLHGSPADRRAAIEEAAGIYKHRRRKDRALRKLAGVEQQLIRLNDLVAEMRRQLKPLQQQAEAARRAAEVQAELREVRLTLRARELRTARATARAAETAQATLTDQLATLEAAHVEAQAVETAVQERLTSAEPAAGRARETVHRLVTVRERLRGTLALAEERARSLSQPLADDRDGRSPEDMLAEAAEAGTELAAIDGELALRRGACDEAEDVRAQAADALDAHDAAVAAAERARADAERALAQAREQALQRAADAERARSRARERILRLQGDLASLQQTLERGQADQQLLAEQAEELTAQAEAAADAVAALTDEAAERRQERERLSQALTAARQAQKAAAGQHAAVTARQRQLESDRSQARGRREAHETAAAAAGGALEALTAGRPDGLLGPLAPALTVDAGYETAVAAALGADAAAVAVAAATDAVAAVTYLHTTDAGRATLLFPPDGETAADPAVGPGPRLLDHLHTSGPAGDTARRLLADVLVADDLEAAQRLHADHPHARIVTLDGDLLASGRVEGGAAPAAGALAARRAAADAAQAEQAATRALEQLAGDLAAADAAQQAAATAVEDAAGTVSTADAAISAAADRLDRAQRDLHDRERQLATLTKRQAELTAAQERHRARHTELQQQLAQPAEPDPETPEEAAAAGTDRDLPPPPDPALRAPLAKRLQHATEQALAARMELSALTERRRLVADRETTLRQRAAAEAEAEQRRARARAARLAAAERATHAARGAGRVLVDLERSLAAATGDRDRLLGQVAAARRELAAATDRRRAHAGELEQLNTRSREADSAHLEARMRDEELARRLVEELGADPDETIKEYAPDDDALTGLPDGDPRRMPDAELRRAATGLERRLSLLGRVNPLALEDYKALEERHGFLAGQLADLKDSRRDLLKVVRAVDTRVREVFAEAYTDVAREFDHTFGLLFPGGEGQLVLTDPEDMLTTGVEIEARPPGKRLRRLSLLSGGERSLVALAFCFAIFRARPSPFYVLDEVEAALDDVNLQRFLLLLEDVRDRAQLLVVSHQRRTMEAADALYGVSMRGAGISKVISQKLRDREPAGEAAQPAPGDPTHAGSVSGAL